MERKHIDWKEIAPKAFRLIASGETQFNVAAAVGVAYSTFTTWFHKKKTAVEYQKFIRENGLKDNRRYLLRTQPEKEKTSKENETENIPMFKDKIKQFKDALKVGDKVKNNRYFEKGIVIAKYPYIFTVRTEYGYLISYGYNCFMDFEKKVKA